MASWWTFLAMILSGFLLSGDFKSIQDGTNTKNAKTPANTNDSKLKAAAEGSNGSSQLPHQGRQEPEKKHTKEPPALPTAPSLSVVLREMTTSFPVEIMTKLSFKGSPKKVLAETKRQTKPKHLLLEKTTMWSWLVEVTSKPSQEPISTLTSEQDLETTGPLSKRKGGLPSPLKKVTPSLAFLDDLSTSSSQNLMDNSGFSTAIQKLTPHTPRPDTKSKMERPLITATSAMPQHQDEISSTSQALVDDTEFSTTAQKPGLDSGMPGLNPRAKPFLDTGTSEPHETQKYTLLDDMSSTSLPISTRSPGQSLGLTSSGSSATTQGTSPLANDTSLLIGKCLLAILLLALVAAIFIVCSGVLALMLWRQKRAYRLGQANHTEMVCISSLLAAEEEEEEDEERRRRPKVKRVQLLREVPSEMEVDNLTLNSFLPEH